MSSLNNKEERYEAISFNFGIIDRTRGKYMKQFQNVINKEQGGKI